jgi:hypothetical protein
MRPIDIFWLAFGEAPDTDWDDISSKGERRVGRGEDGEVLISDGGRIVRGRHWRQAVLRWWGDSGDFVDACVRRIESRPEWLADALACEMSGPAEGMVGRWPVVALAKVKGNHGRLEIDTRQLMAKWAGTLRLLREHGD